ncbi:GAF domain-containing protein [Corallibacter sp.]|uniref:GAF domain-containing protein n=1 Tax=Corallibacter sp. TaxID=2038084 RepID=UPI003AB85096
MKGLNGNLESPFTLKISFNKLLEQYEELANSEDTFLSAKSKRVLKTAEAYPELRQGFTNLEVLKERENEIKLLLQDSFSPVLTKNEIKTASMPFHDIIFNESERFKKIISDAGDDFKLTINNLPEDYLYIAACTIILNIKYGYDLNFKRPFFYEIPGADGIMRYYKILYNADFTEIEATSKAPKITQNDVDELLDNFDNIEMWKQKFPPNTYVFSGFVISNIFNVTDDHAISTIKSNLIAEGKRKDENFIENFQSIFKSFLNIPDIKVGFLVYNKDDQTFDRVYGEGMCSFLLHDIDSNSCVDVFCEWSYNKLLKENKPVSISNVDNAFKQSSSACTPQINALHEQGIKSAIFAPIANDEGLMGILELVSNVPKALNSINANKLVDVMPYIVAAVERSKNEQENLIEAIIQQECTSIHPSVHWRFKQAAQLFIKENIFQNKNTAFSKISFKDVYPLFGQIDVKGSSEARNLATQKDLSLQLSYAEKIIDKALKEKKMPVYEQIMFQVKTFKEQLKSGIKVDSEHQITTFLKHEVGPLFDLLLKSKSSLKDEIKDYLSKLDDELDVIYHYRSSYDNTIKLINKNMSTLLDTRQMEAQNMYPHFFERFKTDGVEHNMYIGESITREDSFNMIYLYNLRLWQIQVMCEMENAYYSNQQLYPISLDVASMILVFNQPLSIRFRMDEKQFDVDGTYNARYEVVKKRVDKAFVKGTDERVTEKGKLSIVYSQSEDEDEYLRYIEFFQAKKLLGDDVQIVELEDLQGVTGLKALKVSILYQHEKADENEFYTYNDLMQAIKD